MYLECERINYPASGPSRKGNEPILILYYCTVISYYHTVLYVRIDRCGGTVFDGVRYKCETCDDFDLCARCQDMHRKPGKIERLPVSYIHHMYGTYANKFFLSLQKALKLRSRPLEL
jgi:hypothetical protein